MLEIMLLQCWSKFFNTELLSTNPSKMSSKKKTLKPWLQGAKKMTQCWKGIVFPRPLIHWSHLFRILSKLHSNGLQSMKKPSGQSMSQPRWNKTTLFSCRVNFLICVCGPVAASPIKCCAKKTNKRRNKQTHILIFCFKIQKTLPCPSHSQFPSHMSQRHKGNFQNTGLWDWQCGRQTRAWILHSSH